MPNGALPGAIRRRTKVTESQVVAGSPKVRCAVAGGGFGTLEIVCASMLLGSLASKTISRARLGRAGPARRPRKPELQWPEVFEGFAGLQLVERSQISLPHPSALHARYQTAS